jgi:integrase
MQPAGAQATSPVPEDRSSSNTTGDANRIGVADARKPPERQQCGAVRAAAIPSLGPLKSIEAELVTRRVLNIGEHTPSHRNCPACEQLRLAIITPGTFALLKFHDAADAWLNDHKERIAPRTHTGYLEYLKPLRNFFSELRLEEIHIGHIKSYQAARGQEAGPGRVNHEINTLKQIMERAGLWAELAKFYKPVRAKKSTAGKALEPDEEQRILKAAASNPRWKVAYWCSLLTATTTAGPGELTHLHLSDIHLGQNPFMRVRFEHLTYGKNKNRDRVIPLNQTACWAAGQLLKRYHKICKRLKIATNPEHFILLGRGRKSGYDPWKPMGSWKKAWGQLCKAAGVKCRRYDWRHQAATKLLENPGISEQTVEEIMGQITGRMKKEYAHIRMQPKQEAVAALEIGRPQQVVMIADREAPVWELEPEPLPDDIVPTRGVYPAAKGKQRSVQAAEIASPKRAKAATGAGE